MQSGDVRFRPSGSNTTYFSFLANRINAAGWRVGGDFPRRVFADAVDFSSATLHGLVFQNCRLNKTLWRNAEHTHCRFGSGTSLDEADFGGAHISDCEFQDVDLGQAHFNGAHLWVNLFVGGSVDAAGFQNVDAGEAFYMFPQGRRMAIPQNRFLFVEGARSIQDLPFPAQIETGEMETFDFVDPVDLELPITESDSPVE